MTKNYLISAPSRIAPPSGIDVGRGGRNRARGLYGIGGPSSSSSSPLQGISDAWTKFLADSVDVGQIALGAALLTVGLLVLLSGTSAGAAAGRGAAGAARRGLRAVPVVGALA